MRDDALFVISAHVSLMIQIIRKAIDGFLHGFVCAHKAVPILAPPLACILYRTHSHSSRCGYHGDGCSLAATASVYLLPSRLAP